jgi:hypothetical protein
MSRKYQPGMNRNFVCSLCNAGFGTKPWPPLDDVTPRCCDACNVDVVAERIRQVSATEVRAAA